MERYAGLSIKDIEKESAFLFRGFKCLSTPPECWDGADHSRRILILKRSKAVTHDLDRMAEKSYQELPQGVKAKLHYGMQ